mgnify:CR=1 FL=1
MIDTRPYPKRDATLCEHDGELQLYAYIGNWNKDFYTYAKGYKDAADFLVQGLINETRTYNFQINELVFPVIFLYTQYLELRLKDIIVLSNRLNHKTPLLPDSLQQGHAIDKIWSHAKPLIMAVSPKISRDGLEDVENGIKQLIAVDPTGMAFRYPKDRKGNFYLPKEPAVINLVHLRETMQKMDVLDGYSEYLEVLWQEDGG